MKECIIWLVRWPCLVRRKRDIGPSKEPEADIPLANNMMERGDGDLKGGV